LASYTTTPSNKLVMVVVGRAFARHTGNSALRCKKFDAQQLTTGQLLAASGIAVLLRCTYRHQALQINCTL
jgi:hypothetical protein